MPSRLPAVTQPVTTAPSQGASHDTTALLRGATASTYADTVRAVADDIAARLASVTQPFSGASRGELQSLVDAVDLDGPPSGTREALRETADLYAKHAIWFHEPDLRGAPELPGRAARRGRGDHAGRDQHVASTPTTSPRSRPSWSAAWSSGRRAASASRSTATGATGTTATGTATQPAPTASSPRAAPSPTSRPCSWPARRHAGAVRAWSRCGSSPRP